MPSEAERTERALQDAVGQVNRILDDLEPTVKELAEAARVVERAEMAVARAERAAVAVVRTLESELDKLRGIGGRG